MPLITTEKVKEIRNEIKKAFPEFKFSIVRRHYTSIHVSILSGPIELITLDFNKRYEQINHYYIADHYKDTPEVANVLQKLYSIINKGNYIESQDGDYGNIPSFYIYLSIGTWEKPYQVIEKELVTA